VIEHSLYFILGFSVAAILSLAVLPAFWRRAYRLSRRELEASLPLSPREIAAERDQLRAKFAVERLRLEQQIDAVNAKRHLSMRETGSKAVAVAALEDELTERRLALELLNSERDTLDANLATTRASLDNAVHGSARRDETIASLTEDLHSVRNQWMTSQTHIAEQSQEIDAYRSNIAAQFQRIEELDSATRILKDNLKLKSDALRTAERTLRELEKDRVILLRRLETSEEIAARRETSIAERDHRLAILHEKATTLAKAGKELDSTLKLEMRRAAQNDVLLRERDLTIVRLREDAGQTARDLTKTIDKLRLDRQKQQGDLSEARAKAAVLQRELNSLKRLAVTSEARQVGSSGRTAK
jgi:hypothetical protein